MIGDRIAAATYLCAVGAAGGEIVTTGVDPDHLTAVLCTPGGGLPGGDRGGGDPSDLLQPLEGLSAQCAPPPHPGFPTDAQAILMAALAGGTGGTMFVEEHLLQPLPPRR